MLSIALLSDIHGNLPGLDAVVHDIEARCPDAVYVLGDMINGCPWSAEVMARLLDLGWPMLLGNHDDAVLQLGTPRMEPRYADRPRYAALWWTLEHLSARHLAALAALPLEYGLAFPDAPPLRLLHGLPGNFFVGFRPDSPEHWAAHRLSAVAERTVAGGHTHVPMARWISRSDAGQAGRGWLVINSGSAGVPYDGDPRASYVWLEGDRAGWRAEVRRVSYDWEALERGYRQSSLSAEGGVLAEMFLRSALTGLPWVADFMWWVRKQFGDEPADMRAAQRRYDASHGPGRWAFPLAT
jgi:predicted phosphodiesterase